MEVYGCRFPSDNNVEILLPRHTHTIHYANRAFHEVGFREIHSYLINQRVIDPSKNFIDLGAWIGDNTIPWAKNITGLIYAIDPSPDNCQFIHMLQHVNSVSNVKIIQAAISETQKIVSTNDELFHCSFVYGNTAENGKHKVQSYSLDFLLEQKVIENIGYIHLDVEGMELNIVQGAEKLIASSRPIISFEQHLETDNVTGICDLIKQKMYTIYLINEVLPGCKPDCRNFLAFPNETNLNFITRDSETYPVLKLLQMFFKTC
jgi:FkbM family methyltransferase